MRSTLLHSLMLCLPDGDYGPARNRCAGSLVTPNWVLTRIWVALSRRPPWPAIAFVLDSPAGGVAVRV